MQNPFKGSKVQRFNRIFFGLLFLTLELLNPLNLELLFAQANYYQGKTLKIVVGSASGGGYDLWHAYWRCISANISQAIQP